MHVIGSSLLVYCDTFARIYTIEFMELITSRAMPEISSRLNARRQIEKWPQSSGLKFDAFEGST